MVELVPLPFGVLLTRLKHELERKKAAFDLPARQFFNGAPKADLSVSIHGKRASTPFGPAAGPHTQLAQNIILSWLAGGRVIELKTVQIMDELVIPRPCIDMQTIGYNVEWSQELRLAQSLEEYVKAAMAIEILKAEGLAQGFSETVFDMSVGYDLAGISSKPVRTFIEGLKDASALVERLRAEIPREWARYRDLPFPTRISDTLTLSTFHGCPPEEIEGIAAFLMKEVGLDVVVKLNPTLLGREELDGVLKDRLGYKDVVVPDEAFAKDAKWPEVQAFVARLGDLAKAEGKSFGVKFNNTLLVKNHKRFFPSDAREMYLSGSPLHLLAMSLVRRFRRTFGDRFPISFSAGIDAFNFADAVALGLKPVSVCSDLLKPGGYSRGARMVEGLAERMGKIGAPDIDSLIIKAHGNGQAALESLKLPPERQATAQEALAAGGDLRAAAGDAFPAWVSAARLANTEAYVEKALADPRYAAVKTNTPPRKVGSKLALFDCLTCDKCIPVCPNDANFTLSIPPGEIRSWTLVPAGSSFAVESVRTLAVDKRHQIANFADACNECGNCDVFCPEDGGPYLAKPRFFSSRAVMDSTPRDGLVVEASGAGLRAVARFEGKLVTVETDGGRARFTGEDFDIRFDPTDPSVPATGTAKRPVDLAAFFMIEALVKGATAPDQVNFVTAGLEAERK